MNEIADFFSRLWQSLLSIVKVLLLSKFCIKQVKVGGSKQEQGIVILGNGPSLNDTVACAADFLESHDLLAVNFAACTPLFKQLRPTYYVLADPHYFKSLDQPNVAKMWDNIAGVEWNMTLFVPAKARLPRDFRNSNLNVARYNVTPVEGFAWLENVLFSSGLGMPRPRNVLIPSIMTALRMGYRNVYLAGADHSWTRTLSVDDNNNVVSIQPHFYKEDDREVKRVNTEYMHYPLHSIMYSFYVAFKSYFTIARYARHIGADVYNITPGSFIDAFPRMQVGEKSK